MNQPHRCQQTIAHPVSLEGFGFWSGRDARVEFQPAAPDTGIVFLRQDQQPPVSIPAQMRHRIEVPRRTVLADRTGRVRVEMVEHILAALAGLEIDNCRVCLNAPEVPGFDGSSWPIVQVLDAAGITVQEPSRPRLVVSEIIRVGDHTGWVEARPPLPGTSPPSLTVHYRLDYGSRSPIGRESLRITIDPPTFRRELAAARTFILKTEAEWLQQQGLGRRTTARDLLVFDDQGPIDNHLRFADECVRHKVLDLVGDLALAGCDLVGHFVAHRSGHRLNARLVHTLLQEHPATWQYHKTA